MKSCQECKGKCCRSMAIQIPKPKTEEDFENLKWYTYHGDIFVYLDDDGDWLAEIPIRCEHLTKSSHCKIYNNRPPICRAYDPKTCNNANDQVIIFRTAKDVDRYVEKLKKQGKLKIKKNKH
ncbi:YkgJ family cysteine cluster protein [Nanoarchaeota archaeon]